MTDAADRPTFRCAECDLEGNAGAIATHHRYAHHGGRVPLPPPGEPRRDRWRCSECGVEARHASGATMPEPRGWSDGLCISCRTASGDADHEPDEEVLEVELRRGTHPNTAAKLSGTSSALARATRKRLVAEGAIEPPRKATDPGRHGSGYYASVEKIEKELREDPDRGNKAIARKLHAAPSTVRRVRKQLGLPPATNRRPRREPVGA